MDTSAGSSPSLAVRLQGEHDACRAAWQAAAQAADAPARQAALRALSQRLDALFFEEEALAFPAAQRAGWTGGTAVYEFRYQHQALRQLLGELRQEPTPVDAWARFGQLLHEHFQGEEMLILPLLPDD